MPFHPWLQDVGHKALPVQGRLTEKKRRLCFILETGFPRGFRDRPAGGNVVSTTPRPPPPSHPPAQVFLCVTICPGDLSFLQSEIPPKEAIGFLSNR